MHFGGRLKKIQVRVIMYSSSGVFDIFEAIESGVTVPGYMFFRDEPMD